MIKSYTNKSIALVVAHRTPVVWMLGALIVLTVLFTPLSYILIEFLMLGRVPGTNFVIPYWIMFTAYVGLLLMIALVLIEDYFYMHDAVKKYSAKRKPTRRRYSHS